MTGIILVVINVFPVFHAVKYVVQKVYALGAMKLVDIICNNIHFMNAMFVILIMDSS